MVAQIVIAQSDCIQPVTYQADKVVITTRLTALIPQRKQDRSIQTQQPISLTQQHHITVEGDLTAVELSLNNPVIYSWKFEPILGTDCYWQSFFDIKLNN
jgi:hypothetical protein